MQTFLPYKSFEKSAKCLDYKRLGKQRIETWQIYSALKQGEYKECPECYTPFLSDGGHKDYTRTKYNEEGNYYWGLD